jgi:hypothetical protein
LVILRTATPVVYTGKQKRASNSTSILGINFVKQNFFAEWYFTAISGAADFTQWST